MESKDEKRSDSKLEWFLCSFGLCWRGLVENYCFFEVQEIKLSETESLFGVTQYLPRYDGPDRTVRRYTSPEAAKSAAEADLRGWMNNVGMRFKTGEEDGV